MGLPKLPFDSPDILKSSSLLMNFILSLIEKDSLIYKKTGSIIKEIREYNSLKSD